MPALKSAERRARPRATTPPPLPASCALAWHMMHCSCSPGATGGRSDGGELVHDYQLSSSTGGACAWDWLITFGFVPRDAQKVVACARVRVRCEVFELPADAAALARLDGEDARRALEGALLALPPERVDALLRAPRRRRSSSTRSASSGSSCPRY